MTIVLPKPLDLGYYESVTPNDYYFNVCSDLWSYGDETRPRGLLTKELHPTFAKIEQPRKRITSVIGRVLNLPFALAEVVQILAGKNDAQALKYYNSKIMEFQGDAPDAVKFNAAYGERIRKFDVAVGATWSPVDQLEHIVETLRADPDSRQAQGVLWHPYWDNYTKTTRDRACNVSFHAMIRNGKLDWLQVMRSNDIIFGLPYNIMQWTHVQEWVATQLGVPMGTYTLVQDSLHCYEHQFAELKAVAALDMYATFGDDEYFPMRENIIDVAHWEKRIREFGPQDFPRGENEYWREVIEVFNSYAAFKRRDDAKALNYMPTTFELRWPLCRWYVHTRWSKKEEFTDLVDAVVRDLTKTGFPVDKIADWLGLQSGVAA